MPARHLVDPAQSAANVVFAVLDEPPIVVGGKAYRAYELPVPQRDEDGAPISPPYLTVQLYVGPDVVWQGGRATVEVEATVVAVGPEGELPLLQGIYAEADQRLPALRQTWGPDGELVSGCQRRTALRYPGEGAERVLMHVGGVWVLNLA